MDNVRKHGIGFCEEIDRDRDRERASACAPPDGTDEALHLRWSWFGVEAHPEDEGHEAPRDGYPPRSDGARRPFVDYLHERLGLRLSLLALISLAAGGWLVRDVSHRHHLSAVRPSSFGRSSTITTCSLSDLSPPFLRFAV